MTQVTQLPHVSRYATLEMAPEAITQHLTAAGIVEAWGEPQPYEIKDGRTVLIWDTDSVRATCRVWFMEMQEEGQPVYEGPWSDLAATVDGTVYQSTNDLALALSSVMQEAEQVRAAAFKATAEREAEQQAVAEFLAQQERENLAAAAERESSRLAVEAQRWADEQARGAAEPI